MGAGEETDVPAIHLRGVSYAPTTATTLFHEVDLDLVAGPDARWVGVVGANGAGKTTLLRLLAGELLPTAGDVDVHAAVRPWLVPQDVRERSDDVVAFATTWDGSAEKLRSRLALDPDDVVVGGPSRWRASSPGQRKRWQVAAAVAARPAILLLDEPTNHLDVAARDLVLDTLVRFDGLGLVVSHDRAVLDRLTGRTLRLHDGRVTLHAGPYGQAAPRWQAEEQRLRDGHDRAARELRRERRILAEVRRERHGAEARPRRERRLAGAHQPDTREAGRKFAQRKAEGKLANRVGQLNARVGRAEDAATAAGAGVARDHAGDVAFHPATTGRRVLAEFHGHVRHAGGQVWLRDVEVVLRRGDRVHLAGANGAGKTTLLRALLAQLEGTDEVVATLAQELDDPVAELARLRTLAPDARGRVLGTVARLGVDPDRLLVTDAPSPGEVRKLVLARALAADDVTLLVLDEPTNHLDLPAIEHLQAALAAWPGALMVVTHDEHLAAATTGTTWTVADGRVTVGP
jgi:ATPase subunit of ABC transporter with duplicated ATPase domains